MIHYWVEPVYFKIVFIYYSQPYTGINRVFKIQYFSTYVFLKRKNQQAKMFGDTGFRSLYRTIQI